MTTPTGAGETTAVRQSRVMLTCMRGLPLLLLLVSLHLTACPAGNVEYDFDGDGWDDSDDCAPEDATINPDADDPYGDGVDANCDGLDGLDADGDGYPGNEDLSDQPDLWDCNDADPDTHPGAEDVPDDEIDQDCDGPEARSVACLRHGEGHHVRSRPAPRRLP